MATYAETKASKEVRGAAYGFEKAGAAMHTPEARAKANESNTGMPKAVSGNVFPMRNNFKSFAHKIREITNDGWEIIDAVYEVFQRARENQSDALILETATWLADRGFGKPVQVGQLLDMDGNAVGFTLWTPAQGEPGNTVTIIDGKVVDETPTAYLPPAEALENPKVKDIEPQDRYAQGLARPWGIGEPEPKPGE